MLSLKSDAHSLAAFGLVALGCAALWAERGFPSSMWVIAQGAGLVALLAYLSLLYQKRRAVLFTSFYQVFYWLGILASAVAISGGTYMIEIEQTGAANGTFWLALVFFVLGMEMTVAGFHAGSKTVPGLEVMRLSGGVQKLVIFSAVGLALGLSAYVLLRYHGPVLLNKNRVAFWSEFSRPLSLIPTLVTQTFFFAAYYYLWRVRHRRSRILAAAIIGGYLLSGYFILGQKFSLYIIYLNAWLFLIAALLPEFKIKTRTILAALLGCAVLFAIVSIAYVVEGREVGFILTRIALQSQLLWSVMDDGSALSLMPANAACLFACDGFANGQDYISHTYLPLWRYQHYRDGGTVLSGFSPALPLATIGLLATAALYSTASFLLGWLQRKAVNAFSRENMIYGFLIFKIQLGLSMLVATGMISVLPGVALAAVCVVVYHLAFHKGVSAR